MCSSDLWRLLGVDVAFRDWCFSVIIPAGLGLMGWHFLARLLYALVGFDPGDRSARAPTAEAIAETEGGAP